MGGDYIMNPMSPWAPPNLDLAKTRRQQSVLKEASEREAREKARKEREEREWVEKVTREMEQKRQEDLDRARQAKLELERKEWERANQRSIFYLITKKNSRDRPSYEDFEKTVQELVNKCLVHNVKSISMPRIGCGLDGLSWDKVRPIIQNAFSLTDIDVTIYYLPGGTPVQPPSKS